MSSIYTTPITSQNINNVFNIPPDDAYAFVGNNLVIGRSSVANMSIYAMRNNTTYQYYRGGTYYTGLNDASAKSPTRNGQSGYAWSHWMSYYHHTSGYPLVEVDQIENTGDVNVRVYAWDSYGVNYIREKWYYFAGTFNIATDNGVTVREGDQIQAYWHQFNTWGTPSATTQKRVYSFSRSYIFIDDGPANVDSITTFYPLSSEHLLITGYN